MKPCIVCLVLVAASMCPGSMCQATDITAIRPGPTPVPLYGKFEVEFDLSNAYTNPFDPDEIDAILQVVTPSGDTLVIPAFWFQEFERSNTGTDEILTSIGAPCWKARFAPTETGTHTYFIEINDSEGQVRSGDATFTCEPSADRGYVRPDPSDSRLFTFDDGSYYLPIGHNVAWASNLGTYDYDMWFSEMEANGENWTRIWMTHFFRGQSLEWSPNWTGYFHGLGVYSLECAWKIDYMVEMARQKGIYIQLVTQHHGQLSTTNYPNWPENPYNTANGGMLSSPEQFFTNAEAKDLCKRKMRYTIARWGYSTSILCWEFWNEVAYTDNYDAPAVTSWHEEMAQYVESIDPWEHMLTTSVSAHPTTQLTAAVWSLPEMDCTQLHLYVSEITNTIRGKAISMWTHGKPVIVGEFGCWPLSDRLADTDGTHIHNAIWSAAMAMTGAMSWWWGIGSEDYIHFYDLYYHYAGLNSFFQGEDLRDPTLDILTVAVVGARGYAFGSNTCAYVWIQDPGNTLGGVPEAVISGASLEIPGMANGDYDIEYWNTFSGDTTSTEIVTCIDGTLRLDIPDFSLDVALKVERQDVDPSSIVVTLDPATHVMACGENITYHVNVDANALDLMGMDYKINYDAAKLSFVSAAVGDLLNTGPGEYVFTYHLSSGVLHINSAHLGTGVNGPGAIAEVTFQSIGSTSPSSATLTFSDAELRDSGNQTLASAWNGASVVIDCVDPTITVTLDAPPSPWTCYNTVPTVDISAGDDYDLDCVKYKIDGGAWTDIVCGLSGTGYTNNDWALPGFGGLSDASHTYYFASTDDAGNESSEASVTFTKDTVDPSAVSGFTATVNHNQIVLDWTNPGTDVDRIYLYRNDWTDYPEYVTDPGYPTVGSYDSETDVGAVDTYTDTFTDATRGIYAYRAVVYDCAGNYAAASGGDFDRATSYFLGDVTDVLGWTGGFDGLVDARDINNLSSAYWLYSPTSPPAARHNECDVGPTDDYTRLGVPVPDDYVDFEDLMIFALNYDSVPPPGPPGPPLLAVELASVGLAEDALSYRLSLREVSQAGEMVELALVVEGNDVFKGLSAEVSYEHSGLEFISMVPSDALLRGSRVMFMGDEVEGVVRIDLAALGDGLGIGGNGPVATLTFRRCGESGSSVRITSAGARDVDNNVLLLSVDDEIRVEPGLPEVFSLRGNSPNPFTGSTEISYDIPREASMMLRIYNIHGQVVRTLVDGSVAAGRHSATWDGHDSQGRKVSAGVYFCKMKSGSFVSTCKVMINR